MSLKFVRSQSVNLRLLLIGMKQPVFQDSTHSGQVLLPQHLTGS